ncbi:hypothetical protein [Vagococcus fluvialis]|uniref:hypothetical protein n=1 Tax=Vagococcus fluvialis TaxID=2738 RepID=UPI002583576C|nr:hypothetical protein [uncultured Vagococcus sp.]
MNGLIIGMLVISLLVTIFSFVFIVKDLKVMTINNYKGSYIIPNAMLLVVGLMWFAVSILLYLNIQNQLSVLVL